MQEAYRDDPWALLVGCILFNMVHGSKARPVLEEFLRRWPTPDDLWLSEDYLEDTLAEMRKMFRPLGFQNRRADRIWKMTFDFIVMRVNPGIDVSDLHGCGKYAVDSYNIFCRGYLVEDVRDKELRRYVDWALGRQPGGVVPADASHSAEAGGGHAEARQPGPGRG